MPSASFSCPRSPARRPRWIRRLVPVAVLAVLPWTLAAAADTPAEDQPDTVVAGDPLTGDGAVDRTLLTVTDLVGTADAAPAVPAATIPDAAFALPAEAAMPRHTFSGRLDLLNENTVGGYTKILDIHAILGIGAVVKHIPEVSVELTQTGSHLIPTTQGIQITGHRFWNLIVGPGRAWSEQGDEGWSRAALPFTLAQRNANCAHVGTFMFLFDDTRVSQVRYQVTQETCPYFKYDMWGQADATYTPYEVPDADAVRAAHAAEVAHRLPTKPISQLAVDHPDADLDLTAFGSGITPEHLSTYGLLYQGVNYVSDCNTRQGTYPFCEQMRMSTFSVAKSAFAATALMVLAADRGPEVTDELIGTWVPEAADPAAGWTDVTVGNVLDMASGHYESPDYMVDEEGWTENSFVLAETYAARMAVALSFPRQADPGTQWVYRTADTFVAATAMRNILGADLFDLVRDRVYVPAKLSQGALTTTRSDNSPTGTPIGGYGLFLTRDDIAKLAMLFNNDGGRIAGDQVLHPELLAAAMQRNPEDRGLATGESGGSWYNNGFWAAPITPEQHPRYSCSFWVPFMSGYGGTGVMMMPNGATYYYVSDNEEYVWVPALDEADKLSPHCPRY